MPLADRATPSIDTMTMTTTGASSVDTSAERDRPSLLVMATINTGKLEAKTPSRT
jgi:hypothetical protein